MLPVQRVCVLLIATAVGVAQGAEEYAWIRVNQVGYLPDDPKIAVLSADRPITDRFAVGNIAGEIGPDQGAWGPFAHNYRINFTGLIEPGTYRIRCGDVVSPEFRVGKDAYADVPAKLLQFMQLQRCGDNPVTERKCHQQDAIDTDTGERVNLVGGWHDAGDRLKHMITTSYCVAALKLAGADDEAAHGADLVRRLHPNSQTFYVQIGDDRDHLPPATLWHDDQSDYGWGPGGPRSAWRATGQPEGPKYKNKSDGLANLAGRCSAAMTLMGDLETAKSLYRAWNGEPRLRDVGAGPRAVLLRREHLPRRPGMGGSGAVSGDARRTFICARRSSTPSRPGRASGWGRIATGTTSSSRMSISPIGGCTRWRMRKPRRNWRRCTGWDWNVC